MRTSLKKLIRATVPPIRRLYDRRDDLCARLAALEVDRFALEGEKHALETEIKELRAHLQAATKSAPYDFPDLANRIFAAYRLCHGDSPADKSAIWQTISERTRGIHDAIMSGKHVPALDDPASSDLFYGFDNMFSDVTAVLKKKSANLDPSFAANSEEQFIKLAEAMALKRIINPEGGRASPMATGEPIEDVLNKIDKLIGTTLTFPNPFPDEFGLPTSRGIATYRAIHALYQAWRIKQLAEEYGGRVLEVGGGLGRTAYYCYLMGITDYTIIDLPMTNVSQANFLGRVLSPNRISLFGEEQNPGAIRIIPISQIDAIDRFDIMVNVDSLTEMGRRTMAGYVGVLTEKGKVLWSVNHEANEYTVASLPGLRPVGRFPYWMRPGYVEEIFNPSRGQQNASGPTINPSHSPPVLSG